MKKGGSPTRTKIAVIDGLATPTNAKGVAKLLRHGEWYMKLISDFAKIAVPLLSYSRRIVGLCGRRIVKGLLKN